MIVPNFTTTSSSPAWGEARKCFDILKSGEIVSIDGITVRKIDGYIQEGDLYVAGRNTGPYLLVAESVDEWGIVTATDKRVYPFGGGIRVEMVDP